MLEYLKFSIGSMQSGYKSIALQCEDGRAEYEILRAGLLDVAKGKNQAKMSDDCLTKWNSLRISSWDSVYPASDAPTGEAWSLVVCEGGETYRSEGDSSYPREWQQFLEWLDALMPEMEFISPKRVEEVILRCRVIGPAGFHHERLEINRLEQTAHFEKWGEPKSEEATSAYTLKSSHRYDFSNARDYFDELMNLCQQFFDPLTFEENGAFARENALVQVWLKLHDGSTLTGHVDSSVPGWTGFLKGARRYFTDLASNIFCSRQIQTNPMAEEKNKEQKYLYCKVRFKNSYRLYSYRTEDDSLRVGDWVDVPVGQENNVICGRIEKIEHFDAAHVPYPINKTKIIIGKHEGDEEI